MSKPGQDQTRYEVITQEDEVTGDLLLPIPPQLLAQLGWSEGDEMLYIAPGHTSLLYCISVSLSLFLHSVIALFLSSLE